MQLSSLQTRSLAILLATVCGLALFFAIRPFFSTIAMAVFASAALCINFGLLTYFVHFWRKTRLDKKRKVHEQALSEIRGPGRTQANNVSAFDFPETGVAEKSDFTLGTQPFEPPVAIKPVPVTIPLLSAAEQQAPILKIVHDDLNEETRSVENAIRKAKVPEQPALISTPTDQLVSPLSRLKRICRVMKQQNIEVGVWTESELATLASTMLDKHSKDKDMIAILTPQAVVRLNMNRTFEFEHHAQVLSNIVITTGTELQVNYANSSKQRDSGQCVVNFEYQGNPITWRFLEAGDRLSERYVKNVLQWVGKKAHGRFLLLESGAAFNSFVFVPTQILRQLSRHQMTA